MYFETNIFFFFFFSQKREDQRTERGPFLAEKWRKSQTVCIAPAEHAEIKSRNA